MASLGLGALVLSGCSGTVMQSQVGRPGADRYFQYGAAPGEMLAVVVGNPFPVSKQVVDQAVVDAMYLAFAEEREPLTGDMLAAVAETVPLSKLMSEQIVALRKWAKGRCRSAGQVSQNEKQGRRIAV